MGEDPYPNPNEAVKTLVWQVEPKSLTRITHQRCKMPVYQRH